MKRLRRNIPNPRPIHRASLFFCELLALFLRLAIHRGQHIRIQIALIERSFARAPPPRSQCREKSSRCLWCTPRRDASSAIGRISSASLAAAASASRRAVIGVEPECASCPWNVIGCRSTPFVPSTAPSGRSMLLQHRPLLNVQFKISRRILPLDSGIANRINREAALGQRDFKRLPSRSVRPRSASMVCVPANAEDPNRLRPKRAPSSSAQSTSRTVIGGLPPYCSAMRLSTAYAAITPGSRRATRHSAPSPDDFPESAPSPNRRQAWSNYFLPHRNDVPPATRSAWSETRSRAFSQVGLHASRCAPFSSAVSSRSSFSRSIALLASTGMGHLPLPCRGSRRNMLSASRLANKHSIAHLHLAAHRHHGRPAFDRESFKSVVVVVCYAACPRKSFRDTRCHRPPNRHPIPRRLFLCADKAQKLRRLAC